MLEDISSIELGMPFIIGQGVLAVVLNEIDVVTLCAPLDTLVVEVHDLFVDCHILMVRDAGNKLSKAHHNRLDTSLVVICLIQGVISKFVIQSLKQGVVEFLGENQWSYFRGNCPKDYGM
jgi:hypothetical protein